MRSPLRLLLPSDGWGPRLFECTSLPRGHDGDSSWSEDDRRESADGAHRTLASWVTSDVRSKRCLGSSADPSGSRSSPAPASAPSPVSPTSAGRTACGPRTPSDEARAHRGLRPRCGDQGPGVAGAYGPSRVDRAAERRPRRPRGARTPRLGARADDPEHRRAPPGRRLHEGARAPRHDLARRSASRATAARGCRSSSSA